MIRTRLGIAFAAMVFLAMAQGFFTLWATYSAARHAERSLVATNMLNHYLELGANKQRLKVWFAQSALAGDTLEVTKNNLLEKMSQSLNELQKLAPRDAALSPSGVSTESSVLQLLLRNFALLKTSVQSTRFQTIDPIAPTSEQSEKWVYLISIFDRADGLDMRTVLEQAVVRQRATSDRAEAELATALSRIRLASVWLALTATALGLFAVGYFVKRMQRPFENLVKATDAISQGNYAYRPPPSRIHHPADEFGLIAQQLQALAIKLAAAREQNEHLRQGLDDAVAAKISDVTRSHEALMRIDSRRRQFFTEVSHELRTPVTVIRGEAEIALRGTAYKVDDYRACLIRIVDACSDLGKRVQDLLQVATSDNGPYALQLRPTPISVVLKAALQQMAAVAENRNISLSHPSDVLSPQVEGLMVKADPDRLRQALTIVLDNAVRYSEEPGHVEVLASLDSHQNVVQIVVRDEGIGLTENECSGVFERHFRGEIARSMRPDGAGLGLTIAQAIVVAHHGEIAIQNNVSPGASGARTRGACVTITLPLLRLASSADSLGPAIEESDLS